MIFLLDEQIVNKQELDELLTESKQQGQSLVSIVRAKDLLNRDQMTKLIALDNEIEFVDLTTDMIDEMAVRLIPSETARCYNLIPVKIEKNSLYVAMCSPLNLYVRDSIAAKTGYDIVPSCRNRGSDQPGDLTAF